MTFLQGSLLYGLFALSIPVIIHLLNRRRFRTVKWAAMQFVLKATRESRGKKRLKQIIILTCRSLAIAALIFAISRPMLGGFLGWGSGKIDTVVLILDRSPSMERRETDGQPVKRESVLARVATAMQELDGARLVLIDSATNEAQDIPSPDVLPELSTTGPTDAASDIPGLLSTAIEYLQEAKPSRSEIWIASDLQRTDWSPDDPRWAAFRAGLEELQPQLVQLRILSLNSRKRNDYAITTLAARREAGELLLDLELTREEDAGPATLPITYNINGARSASTIQIEGQSIRFQKRLPLEGQSDGGYGWVAIPTDTNSRNNVSYYAFGAESPAYAYYVHEEGVPEEVIEAVGRAAAPGLPNQELTILPENLGHQVDWERASLVVWQAALPTGPVAEQLLKFIQTGGVAAFLPPAQDSENSFGGISWGSVTESDDGRYFIVKDWNHQDGPLRDGVDGTPVPLQRLRAILRREISGDATELAEWDDGSTLLARRIIDNGTALFLNTLPDYTWSNLEQTAVHLVALQRSLHLGSQRHGAGFFAIAGQSNARPEAEEIRSRLDAYTKDDPANADYEAGVYKFGERTVAVNRSISEDSLEQTSNPDLDTALVGTNFQLFEESAATGAPLVREAWRAFLVAMLLLLIAEALLCLQPKRPLALPPTPHPST